MNTPTKTAETPPKPPAMNDLAWSTAETRVSSAAGASLLYPSLISSLFTKRFCTHHLAACSDTPQLDVGRLERREIVERVHPIHTPTACCSATIKERTRPDATSFSHGKKPTNLHSPGQRCEVNRKDHKSCYVYIHIIQVLKS